MTMNNSIRKFNVLFYLSIVFSVLSTVAILLCVIEVERSIEQIIKILVSLLFWVCLAFEQIFLWKANKLRKETEKKFSRYSTKGVPGAVSFFQTSFGTALDMIFVIVIVFFVLIFNNKLTKDIIQYILLFLIVLSFRLHCFFNGKNYRYKRYLKRRRLK